MIMKIRFMLFAVILLFLFLGIGAGTDECMVQLSDESKGIHLVVGDCYNIGTFSLGALYNGGWEKLTYHYPNPWEGTFLSVKVNDKVYTNSIDSRNKVLMDPYIVKKPTLTDSGISMKWELPENVLVEQTFELIDDGTRIYIKITNENSMPLKVGARLHIDTMLGENDGAPIYIPGDGLKSRESEYSGDNLNFDYWKAFNREENATVVASGVLEGEGLTYPNRFLVTDWKKSMYSSWDYTIDEKRSILGDSAVILYYNPITLSSGDSMGLVTIYKSGEPILPASKGSFGIADVVFKDKSNGIYCPNDLSEIGTDVVSRNAGNRGFVEFSILGSNGDLIYTATKDTGTVSRDSIKTLNFKWKIPENFSNATFNITVKLYSHDGKEIDSKSLTAYIRIDVCQSPPNLVIDMKWFIYSIPLFILIGIVLIFIYLRRYTQWGNIEIEKVRDGDNVKITVWNRTNRDIDNCIIEDRIPEGSEVDMTTIGVVRRGTELTLDVGQLKAGSQAVLEYRISSAEVLPPARVKWNLGEKLSDENR